MEFRALASKMMTAAKMKAGVMTLFMDVKAGWGHYEPVSCPSIIIQVLKLHAAISLAPDAVRMCIL